MREAETVLFVRFRVIRRWFLLAGKKDTRSKVINE